MKKYTLSASEKGFTLIELLIVVVILGILAAVVIPQLASSTDDAKVSALNSNLANLRTAIDLYKQEHADYPGAKIASGGLCTSPGVAGGGGAGSPAATAEQLTMYTNAAGQACTTKDAIFKFGPYLKAAQTGTAGIPANPISNVNTIEIVNSGNLNMTATGGGGWKYDFTIGKIIPNN